MEYVGPLPGDVQRVTVFSAGIGAHGTSAAAGRALVDFLLSPQGRAALAASGLEPIPPR